MMRDKCAVFAIYGARKSAELTYLGLYSLQHRGQESSGIITNDKGTIHVHKGMGEVSGVFSKEENLKKLRGNFAIGHNRYSTTGLSTGANVQPLLTRFRGHTLAVGHNGNITNSLCLKRKLEASGAIFQTTSDSEIILHLVARSKEKLMRRKIANSLKRVQGAYSLVFLTDDGIIAARDPLGVRPLALGRLNKTWVVASETCAFDIIGARYVRDVDPGEVLQITSKGLYSETISRRARHAFCVFEFIYFARPDSKIYGENVDKIRRRLGVQLAQEHPAIADFVISVPDSSNTAALGYSEGSGLKMEIGFIRNHYVGRTFIDPEQKIRDLDVKIKFNPVKGVLKGKRVVVVDDSIVRGTTSHKLVKMLYEAGAKEVHMRISSPPIISPCFYGIDMPTKRELIASQHSVEQIRRRLGSDSLGYLSVEGMLSTSSLPNDQFCVACFSGRYPTVIESRNGKNKLG